MPRLLTPVEVRACVLSSIGDKQKERWAALTHPVYTDVHCEIEYQCNYWRRILATETTQCTANARSLLQPNSRPHEWCTNFRKYIGPTILRI